jgi:hypothetical protein
MQFRWQRVIYAAIAGLLLLAIGDFMRVKLMHRIRVMNADGVWCTAADPDGSVERRYGAANCGE